jgi:hypothetical protein
MAISGGILQTLVEVFHGHGYPQSVETGENIPIDINLEGEGPSDNPLFFKADQPSPGALQYKSEIGKPNVTYTPDVNLTGEDSFEFIACSEMGCSEYATVTITVLPAGN